ncbi:MAG: GTP cyclohydrolase II [Myxococcales bacterium]|nr:MAG: GTP cyclohydrolase II [Myxococcales bacterium]
MTIAQRKQSAEEALVQRYASAEMPTEYGMLRVVVYQERDSLKEHCAIVSGDIDKQDDVLLRVHSECLTGEVLHSLKCDCREQLDMALSLIAKSKKGAVLYLRQEGRGIGLCNKIRAYALQEQGHDTVDANRMLGFDDDMRSYEVASAMLADLGVKSIALLTNNPDKVTALRKDGVRISKRVPMSVEPNDHNRGYLETKRKRMGHLID